MKEEMVIGVQRAILMALVSNILQAEEEDMTPRNVKGMILQGLQMMMESGATVHDMVEMVTMKVAGDYCEQQMAVDSAQDIVKRS